MTRIVVEDTWLVEGGELSEMVADALRRIPVEMCDEDGRTFEIQSFDTDADDPRLLAEGEAVVRASLCHRPMADCRVEFSAVDTVPEDDSVTPAELTVRVVEERIGTE